MQKEQQNMAQRKRVLKEKTSTLKKHMSDIRFYENEVKSHKALLDKMYDDLLDEAVIKKQQGLIDGSRQKVNRAERQKIDAYRELDDLVGAENMMPAEECLTESMEYRHAIDALLDLKRAL